MVEDSSNIVETCLVEVEEVELPLLVLLVVDRVDTLDAILAILLHGYRLYNWAFVCL